MKYIKNLLLILFLVIVTYFGLVSALMYGFMLRDFNTPSEYPNVFFSETTVFIYQGNTNIYRFLGAKRNKDGKVSYYLIKMYKGS